MFTRRRFGTRSSSSGWLEFVDLFSCVFGACTAEDVFEWFPNMKAVATDARLAGKLAEKLRMAWMLDCWKDTTYKKKQIMKLQSNSRFIIIYWLSNCISCLEIMKSVIVVKLWEYFSSHEFIICLFPNGGDPYLVCWWRSCRHAIFKGSWWMCLLSKRDSSSNDILIQVFFRTCTIIRRLPVIWMTFDIWHFLTLTILPEYIQSIGKEWRKNLYWNFIDPLTPDFLNFFCMYISI